MKWRHCGSPPLFTGSDPPRVKGSDAPQARHSVGTDSDGSDRDAPPLRHPSFIKYPSKSP